MISLKPTGVRGSGFHPESMQRATPAMPPPPDRPFAPAAEDWQFVLDNPKLVRDCAARVCTGHIVNRLTDAELIGNAVLGVARARRDFDPARSTFRTHCYRWMMSYLNLALRGHLYHCPGAPGASRSPPLLLGGYEPEPESVGEHPGAEPPRDLVESALDAFAALDGRRRQAVAMYLGMGGPPRTGPEIAAVLGVSRERVRQLVETGVAAVRKAAGVREPADRDRSVKGTWRMPQKRREYQKEYYRRRRAELKAGASE